MKIRPEKTRSAAGDWRERAALSRKETADLLGVCERTVARMSARGQLRQIKTMPGRHGRVLIEVASILRFVAGRLPSPLMP